MIRTNNCGDLTLANVGEKVTLQGWIKKIRKLGGLTFIDLRDIHGITQLVIDENHEALIQDLKPEYVIQVEGIVKERKSKNLNIPTGEIEVEVNDLKIINKSETTPFEIKDGVEASEDTRLKYRYLDLRRPEMQHNLKTRSKVNNIIRNYFNDNDFIEVETPVFAKSTPEGARDFIVPSRLNPGKFYALPQSPQLFKQLLMIAGYDRYFQIVKCFRDEDLRIDRQPEFTQLDMEMSFADSNDVMQMTETLIKQILKEIKGIEITEPLERMPYKQAIDLYGSDKPDLRFGLEIHTLNDIFKNSENKLMQKLNDEKASIRGVAVEEILSKSQLKEIDEMARQFHISGIAFAKYENKAWSGSLASTMSDEEKNALLKEFNILVDGKATFLINGGEYDKISQTFGAIRNQLAKMFNLYTTDYKLLWIVDFPLFEWSEEENRYVACHHPFTMPKEESLNDFDTNKKEALADAYDIVMNGFEIGGGSRRITDPQLQERMFKAIELTDKQVEDNFGWFVNAYNYGAPYHAGLALGLDRIVMLLTNADSIRDVIAFPKNARGIDPMTNAPDSVTDQQLKEVHIKLDLEK
ncbi:aspartate--tRNA ligase [Mesoplasma lactucae]|uniref:Aspartate--tRNA ligase n=1 Tax=Mesoplasma lactucae ATCC 49193 TaxID=81460 RepID=A0A291IRK7_9MOLU|nr:aspartate--tRNA ligase [Mesoplasma lactucae]ATG97364.1 aspartate--tRNA ligase [Mesoplasma lactucae ATCC 49193]ATZ20184.1 aspartyl-tRNA synthetase [Mesoplasma lactucae ATCC 49193]MCL8216933.1 Aspartate--tRNA ligase [Mesoplasma lactucae ATCC 49193]